MKHRDQTEDELDEDRLQTLESKIEEMGERIINLEHSIEVLIDFTGL